jgi:hypothetical protein
MEKKPPDDAVPQCERHIIVTPEMEESLIAGEGPATNSEKHFEGEL